MTIRRVGQARQGGLGLLTILLLFTGLLVAAPAASAADYVAMGDSYSSGTGTRDYYAGQEEDLRAQPDRLPGPDRPVAAGELSPLSPVVAPTPPTSQPRASTARAPRQRLHGSPRAPTTPASRSEATTPDSSMSCSPADSRSSPARTTSTTPRHSSATRCPAGSTRAYNRIRQLAPNARVAAVSYPRIFPANGDDCSAATFFSSGEMERLDETADLLADVTRTRARAHRFTFVDARYPFLGHAWCEDEWLNGLSNPTGRVLPPEHARPCRGLRADHPRRAPRRAGPLVCPWAHRPHRLRQQARRQR